MSDGYKRLRKYLNPSIEGPNVKSLLESIAPQIDLLSYNSKAVNDNLTISTAIAQYLDLDLSGFGVTRPPEIGMLDDIFRRIGISIINRKQVRDLLNEILQVTFGDDVTQANTRSQNFAPYVLQDQDQLILSFDEQAPITITFRAQDFTNISAATAEEVADSITKQIRSQGRTGRSYGQDNGSGPQVYLISDTIGPQSSVKVLGGRAQNILRFPEIRLATPQVGTEWTFAAQPSGKVRMTWTNGADPQVGKVRENDYINAFGSGLFAGNQGVFTVTKVNAGIVGDAYVEFENLNFQAQTYTQGTNSDILFFNPKRNILTDQFRYAVQFQEEKNLLEIFIPATTRVVRRSRIGAAYLQDTLPSSGDDFGPYLYDPTATFYLGGGSTTTTSAFGPNQGQIISVVDATQFPDEQGFVLLGLGTSHQEGPIPYIARPSANTLFLSPAYILQKNQPSGTNVSKVAALGPFQPSVLGTDYPFFVTDNIVGRIYAQELLRSIVAAGITINFTIIYPNPIGLGHWEFPDIGNEKKYIWGAGYSDVYIEE